MQINNLPKSNSIALDLGVGQPSAKSNSRPSAGQDQVQISSLATQLAGDPSKVGQLQASYEAGTYHVSPSQIANSILNYAMLS